MWRGGARSCCGSPTVCAAREHMRLALRKTHVGQKFLESHSRRGSPLYTAPQILLRGPTRRSLKLSDSIVPEALLSDGQEFVPGVSIICPHPDDRATGRTPNRFLTVASATD